MPGEGELKKACVLVAPYPQLAAWRKAFKVVQEKLEKAMSVRARRGLPPRPSHCAGPPVFAPLPHATSRRALPPCPQSHVVLLVADRTMADRAVWARSVSKSGIRPRSRTLKAVQEAVLDDLVFPADIVGKRTRVKTNGSHVLRVILSQKEKTSLFDKTHVLAAVYTKLTNKPVIFEFEA